MVDLNYTEAKAYFDASDGSVRLEAEDLTRSGIVQWRLKYERNVTIVALQDPLWENFPELTINTMERNIVSSIRCLKQKI